MEKEVWKPIIGYEDSYEISNTRKIKSLERLSNNGRILREKEMKFSKNGSYDVVSLRKDGKTKNYYVDVLMYKHFKKIN